MKTIGKSNLFFLVLTVCLFLMVPESNAENIVFMNNESFNLAEIDFININKACSIAISNSPQMDVFASRLKQAEQRSIQAKTYYWPIISFESLLDTKNYLNIVDKNRIDSYGLGLNASWICFDGFERKFRKSIAEYDEKIATAALNNACRMLLLSVSKKFYEAQVFLEKISIALDDVKFNNNNLVEAEKKYKAGSGSLSEVLNFKIKLNNAIIASCNEKNNYKKAMIDLGAIMGISDPEIISNTNIAPFLPETSKELQAPDLDELSKISIELRPDIMISSLFIEQAIDNVLLNMSENYPKIFFSTSINANRTGDIKFCGDDISCDVKLGLSYKFFTGGMNTSIVEEAKERKIELEKQMCSLLVSARAEIGAAGLKIRNIQNQVVSMRENTELMKQTRELVKKEYKSNNCPLTRLNEAHNDFVRSKGFLVAAVNELRHAWIELKLLTVIDNQELLVELNQF